MILDLIQNVKNRNIINDFNNFLIDTQRKSDKHRNSALQVVISFAAFLGPRAFDDVKREDIITFLDSKSVNGKWVKRERDLEQRWISTWNFHLGLCRLFIRWFTNQGREREDWETPSWFKIKNKKSERKSPYNRSQVWEREV